MTLGFRFGFGFRFFLLRGRLLFAALGGFFGKGFLHGFAAEDHQRVLIAGHPFAQRQQLGRKGSGPEERFRAELAGAGDRDERHRVQAVFDGKGLCLLQRLAGGDGDLHGRSAAPIVKHQIIHRIGRAPFKRFADLAFACGFVA